MPNIDTTLHWITSTLEHSAEGGAQLFVEALMWPELSCLDAKDRRQRSALIELAEEMLKRNTLDELSRRVVLSEPKLIRLVVKVEPAKRTEAWADAREVELDVVTWHWPHHHAATVPALGIAVLAEDEDHLSKMLPLHIEAALKREGLNQSLLSLARLQRGRASLSSAKWQLAMESAEERWKRLRKDQDATDPLEMLTTRMEGAFLARAWHVQDQLGQLARLLTLPDKPCVLLVGAGGVGKTALVQELARQRADHGLAKTPFRRSSGARLIAGACGFGMWQQRCRELVEAVRTKPIVLFLGNLFELVNVGQHSASSESIASFLRPYFVRKELQVIVECTPEQLAVLEKDDGRLVDSFRILRLEEPDAARCADVLLATSLELGRNGARFTLEAQSRMQLLFRRYMSTSALPGAAIRFMRRAHESLPDQKLVEERDVYALFSQETGMPQVLLDPEIPLDLAETQQWFSRRVRGQERAVEAVVAAIAQLKAGLSRPGRPLASMLFIGPTGTGKTEMAKALAEFLFHSAERMIRLDMSEFSQPWSAQRLVSGRQDGKEGILTAAVREQPFSVLLLDEFEKADPAVFDLLLQVLGEARLTDAAGRTADFSNCVILMTSNLGAASFGKSAPGFRADVSMADEAVDHFTSAVQKALRPEMFNRIDRIVPYLPLELDVVLELTQRELQAAAMRPGLASRGVRMDVDESVVAHLAELGYDPRYGARPLKRQVADLLLAPMAAQLAEAGPGRLVVRARLGADDQVVVEVKTEQQDARDREQTESLNLRLETAAMLRRRYEQLRNSTMVLGLGSRYRLALQRMRTAKKDMRQSAAEFEPELQPLKQCLERIELEANQQLAAEEALLLALHRALPGDKPPVPALNEKSLQASALAALAVWQPPPKALGLLIRGEPGKQLVGFVSVYKTLITELGGNVECGYYWKTIPPEKLKNEMWVLPDVPHTQKDIDKARSADPKKLAAVLLWVTGAQATLLLRNEGGIHRSRAVRDETKKESKKPTAFLWQCSVEVHVPEGESNDLDEFLLPLAKVTGLPDLESDAQRRLYDPEKMLVREGSELTRSEGQFSVEWLKQRLMDNALKEALA